METRKIDPFIDFGLECRPRWHICKVTWDKVRKYHTESGSAEAETSLHLDAISKPFNFIYKVYEMATPSRFQQQLVVLSQLS